MFYVYILFSSRSGKYYVGQTYNIEQRLKRHNSGMVRSTKSAIPWVLVRSFELESRSLAMRLETKIKKRGIRRYLDDIEDSIQQ